MYPISGPLGHSDGRPTSLMHPVPPAGIRTIPSSRAELRPPDSPVPINCRGFAEAGKIARADCSNTKNRAFAEHAVLHPALLRIPAAGIVQHPVEQLAWGHIATLQDMLPIPMNAIGTRPALRQREIGTSRAPTSSRKRSGAGDGSAAWAQELREGTRPLQTRTPLPDNRKGCTPHSGDASPLPGREPSDLRSTKPLGVPPNDRPPRTAPRPPPAVPSPPRRLRRPSTTPPTRGCRGRGTPVRT